jgi:Flp pilus assembly protein TadD
MFQIAASHDSDPSNWLMRGAAVCLEAGDVASALALYNRVARISPRNADAWYGSALAHTRLGDVAAAQTCIAQALTLRPSDGRFIELQASMNQQPAATHHVGEPP